jgi:hypothetical protein
MRTKKCNTFVLRLCPYTNRSDALFIPGSSVAYYNGLVNKSFIFFPFEVPKWKNKNPTKLEINHHNTKTKLQGCRSVGSSPYNKLMFREVNKTSVAINNTIYINSNTTANLAHE